MATNITDAELQQLLSEGLSQTEIARRTSIPRSTLRRRIGKLNALNVYLCTQELDQDSESNKDLRELLEWWRARKRALQTEANTEQETERKTYHVQKRYIEAIQRAADLERVSIMEIVNRAFKKFFEEGA
jgi:Winged helix-turn-helix DNA-binding